MGVLAHVLKVAAAALRRLAATMEPAPSEALPETFADLVADRRHAALRARYPDAPEAWLAYVAERLDEGHSLPDPEGGQIERQDRALSRPPSDPTPRPHPVSDLRVVGAEPGTPATRASAPVFEASAPPEGPRAVFLQSVRQAKGRPVVAFPATPGPRAPVSPSFPVPPSFPAAPSFHAEPSFPAAPSLPVPQARAVLPAARLAVALPGRVRLVPAAPVPRPADPPVKPLPVAGHETCKPDRPAHSFAEVAGAVMPPPALSVVRPAEAEPAQPRPAVFDPPAPEPRAIPPRPPAQHPLTSGMSWPPPQTRSGGAEAWPQAPSAERWPSLPETTSVDAPARDEDRARLARLAQDQVERSWNG
ncbi:hypothetical protein GC209_01290 [bacterium]|nr:hypothetical protein [bacterium]